MINFSLRGKRALVCGASDGIGKAVAVALAEYGCEIFPLARSQDKLVALLNQIEDSLRGEPVVIDVSRREALENKIKVLLKTYEGFHILVNNTGGPPSGLILEATETEFLQGFQNHVLVSSLLTKLVTPYMKKIHAGRIINIISTSVKTPLPGLGVSNTIRAAMANWSKTLAMELAPYGITVNNILPGYTQTDRLTYLMGEVARKTGKDIKQVEQEWIATIPMGRIGKPEEIAAAAAFLASPSASYVTGTNITVDGGRTACL